MLLYITVIILPNVELSSKASKEIAGISQARLAAEKIINTTNEVALSGEVARQTITVYAPAGSLINCESSLNAGDPAIVSFDYEVEITTLPPVDGCINDGGLDINGSICTKRFNTLSNFNIACNTETFPLIGGDKGVLTTISIDKNSPLELTILADTG